MTKVQESALRQLLVKVQHNRRLEPLARTTNLLRLLAIEDAAARLESVLSCWSDNAGEDPGPWQQALQNLQKALAIPVD